MVASHCAVMVALCAGDQKSKACGIMCNASRSWHGHQNRYTTGQEGQGRSDGVLAGSFALLYSFDAVVLYM